MTRNLRNMILAGALIATPVISLAATTTAIDANSRTDIELAKKVRKELVTLPFYSVFDNFAYSVDDGVVTLLGQVSRPTLKTDAGRVVARLEGVKNVNNQIEVLPLSPYDDRIRLAVLRAIYAQPALSRYGAGTQPSIRIIVKRGEVTLEGVVDREMDRNIAFLRANGVSGVFKVTNNLRIANNS
jgi:hyperosmotically inducible protein